MEGKNAVIKKITRKQTDNYLIGQSTENSRLMCCLLQVQLLKGVRIVIILSYQKTLQMLTF